jgi:ribonuclease P protein component
MPSTFGPGARLRSRREFTAVQEKGRRVATRHLTLLAMPNTLGRDRLGIIASRRLGGAVARNRAKRRLREIFRRREERSPEASGRALDLVAIPRRELNAAPFAMIQSEFLAALGRLRTSRQM